MIVFELTMPGSASWNGHWSGEQTRHIITRDERTVPRNVWGKAFRYRWDDGWEAQVIVSRMSAKDARKLRRISAGFCGYGWMVESIVKNGCIKKQKGGTMQGFKNFVNGMCFTLAVILLLAIAFHVYG